MALLKYLFPILFLAFSLGELARIRVFASVNSGFFDLVLISIIAIWIFFSKKSKYSLLKPILIFSGVCLLSLVINLGRFHLDQIFISSLYLVRFILYSGIYFVLVDLDKANLKRIPIYMFFSGLLVIVLGFLQYFFYPNLVNLYYLGWDNHMYRLFSTFLDPNFTGAFFVLFLVFIFILKDKIFSKKYIWVSYVVMVLNLIAIVLTFSRGALLMLLVSVVTYSFFSKNWKITGGIIIGFVLVFFILSPKFYVENMNLLRFASTEARLESAARALSIWKDNPMGVGFNTYRYARTAYEPADWTNVGPSHAGSGVDNSFILVLVTAGFVGLGAYVYLLYRTLKLGYMNIKKNKFALVLVVSLTGLIINSLFINSLFYSFLLFWVFVLAGLTERSLHE